MVENDNLPKLVSIAKKLGAVLTGSIAFIIAGGWAIQFARDQFSSRIGVFHQFDPFFSALRFIGGWIFNISSTHWCIFTSVVTTAIAILIFGSWLLQKTLHKPAVFTGLSIVLGLWARFVAFHNHASVRLPWILLCCSFLFAGLAAYQSKFPQITTISTPSKKVWICLVLVLVIGFLFRAYRVDTLPPGHAQHTAQWGMIGAKQALQQKATLMNGEGRRFLFKQIKMHIIAEAHQEGLNIFVDWLLSSWFGPSLVVQRTATAMVGLLSLVALYWAAGISFGRKIACLAMFFAAISPWHVMHSRYSSIEHILPILLITLSMGLLEKYLQTRSLKTAFLLLIVLIADFHVYITAQFIVPIVVIVWLISIYQMKSRRRSSSITLAVVLLVLSIGIAPKTGLYGCKDQVSFLNTSIMAHPSYVVQGPNIIVKNMISVFRGLFLNGEGSFWFHKTNGHLIWPVSIALVLGLAFALVNFQKRAFHSLAIWFFIGLSPALPSSEPAPRRLLCALPAIYILAGLGVDRSLSQFSIFETKRNRWSTVCLWIVFVFIMVCGAWVAFEKNSLSREDFTNGKERRLAEIACNYLPDYTVYLLFDPYTRIQKIWMICGRLGPEEPSPNAVKFLDPESDLDTLIKTRAIQPVSEEKQGVVFIFPAYRNGLTTIEDVMMLFPEGDHQMYRFDPRFIDHDKGNWEFQSWMIHKYPFNEVLENLSISAVQRDAAIGQD